MSNTKKAVIISFIFIAGLAIGRFSLPAKIVEKEHIVYQDKIIEKKVEIADIRKKDHKIYIRVEKTSPDGTKTIETRIVNDASVNETISKTDDFVEVAKTTTDKEKTTTYSVNNTLLSLGVKVDSTKPNLGISYGLFLSERVVGPFYLGAFGFLDKTFGLSLGVTF